eukprot:54218-Rhodomonas_salina.1
MASSTSEKQTDETERMRSAGQNSDPSLRGPHPGPDRETGRQDAGLQCHFNHCGGGGHKRGRRTREHQANAILDRMQR